MTNSEIPEEIVGYLIRRELENGDDEFWNPIENWVSDPSEAELYEEEEKAVAVSNDLRKSELLTITVEEVYYDNDEEDF